MAESRPPGEEDTFYFADNLEQNGKRVSCFPFGMGAVANH